MPDDSDRTVNYTAADAPTPCESLHIQPEKWRREKGVAFCSVCGKWMGNVIVIVRTK